MYHMQAPETLLITHIVKSSMESKFQCVLIYIEGACMVFFLLFGCTCTVKAFMGSIFVDCQMS